MRTIKFRGKRVDNEEWVYGDLVHTTRVLNGKKTHHVLIGVDLELDEVHPETVGQLLGLHDKDGNIIWEGDLFQVAKNKIYQIKYHEGESDNEWCGGCFVLYSTDKLFFPFDVYAINNGEVIGNMYDKIDLTPNN
jgi:uncharacterized phage protein (TIGR01671 family)